VEKEGISDMICH